MVAVPFDQAQAPNEPIEPTPELVRKRRGQFRIIFDRFVRNRLAVAGLFVLVIMTVLAILAPVLTGAHPGYDPSTYIPPNLTGTLQGPSAAHLLGTDDLGRDEFARMLYGARTSLQVGLLSMLMAVFVGIAVGALAGFYGGWLDAVLMRIVDALLALPLYLILFLLSASFLARGTPLEVVLLIASFSWLYTARVVRGEFLALKQREFVLASRTLGASDLRLIVRHVLPNALGPILVSATLLIGNNIIVESTLSFFGFGLQAPESSWGVLLANAEDYFSANQILVWAPGLAILITVLAFNVMGDGLRDALDPYLTER
jgi:peptide/nickel transport system permease protein